MSWSVSASGKASEVAKNVGQQFISIKCDQPEEAIKNSIAMAVMVALAGYAPDDLVTVKAHGSQSVTDDGTKKISRNSMNLMVMPGDVG